MQKKQCIDQIEANTANAKIESIQVFIRNKANNSTFSKSKNMKISSAAASSLAQKTAKCHGQSLRSPISTLAPSAILRSNNNYKYTQQRSIVGLVNAIDKRIYRFCKTLMPPISATEQTALDVKPDFSLMVSFSARSNS